MEKCSTWNILSILICTYIVYGMQGKRLSLLDLCRQLLGDEFAPELERRVPVLFPFWKGWMLLGAKSVFEYPSASPSAPLRAGGKSRDASNKQAV